MTLVPPLRYSFIHLHVYICTIYTPNLGFEIAVSGREREQRGSIEGARGSTNSVWVAVFSPASVAYIVLKQRRGRTLPRKQKLPRSGLE